MKNVAVIGIGKLGLCFALTLEKEGFNVVGVDISETYIRSINDKQISSSEPGVEKYLKISKNIVATTDLKKALDHSNIIFLFVATPSLSNGRYDHSQIDRVVEEIAHNGSASQIKHLIIGCTTMPGYCDTIQKRLEKYGYVVSYNPEFIAQGSIMHDLVNPDILLIGEGSQSAGIEIENTYSNILNNKPSIHKMSRKEAEITKIALNCFLTTKIAYANMVGDIAISAGCEPDRILNAVGSDARIGKRNLKYGFGFGGPCFPRDNRALATYAEDIDINAIISKASDTANQLHLNYQVEEFKKHNDISKQIIFTELSFKPGTTIIEESQKLAMAVKLSREGFQIVIQDDQEVINQIKSIYGDLFHYQKK